MKEVILYIELKFNYNVKRLQSKIMIRLYTFILICSVFELSAQTISPFIHIDQFGYLPNATKVAVLSDPQVGYNANLAYNPSATLEVRNAIDNSIVLTVSPTAWNSGATDSSSGDRGWWLDFSSLTDIGTYYVFDVANNERSGDFKIGLDVYNDVLKTAGRMYFYNRCNFEKAAPYAEAGWTDGNNFSQDFSCKYIYDSNNSSLEKDLSGGWFDAGDYNKYVTFTHSVIHDLLAAFEENELAFDDNWNIPESGNGIPDLLDEVRWELEWLLKMTNPDGSVHNKVGSSNYNENTEAPPSLNVDPRYYGPTCSSSSIAVASMFAHAARVYATIDASFATVLENNAIAAWNHALTFANSNSFETDCDDGSIVAGDADWDVAIQKEGLLTAAAHLLELTGNTTYSTYINNNISDAEFTSTGSWSAYKLSLYDAMLMYANHPNADPSIANSIRVNFATDASNNWNGYYGFIDNDLYRAFMPTWSYHWGSNNPKASYGSLNYLLNKYNINPSSASDYKMKSEELLHYFHGVNPLGIVYLSNMYTEGGDRCINEIYHTWFNNGTDWDNALTSLYGPASGYVVGGPNSSFSVGSISPPSGQPNQKSYLDFNDGFPNNSWELSEPAIYYQAAYIRLLANMVDASVTTSTQIGLSPNCIEIFPNPTNDYFVIKGDLSNFDIRITNSAGATVQTILSADTQEIIDISNLGSGLYFVMIESKTHGNLTVQKIIKE